MNVNSYKKIFRVHFNIRIKKTNIFEKNPKKTMSYLITKVIIAKELVKKGSILKDDHLKEMIKRGTSNWAKQDKVDKFVELEKNQSKAKICDCSAKSRLGLEKECSNEIPGLVNLNDLADFQYFNRKGFEIFFLESYNL